jgi:hypothetical protein
VLTDNRNSRLLFSNADQPKYYLMLSRALSRPLRHHSAPIPRLSNSFRGAAFWDSQQGYSFSRTCEIALVAAKNWFFEFCHEQRRTEVWLRRKSNHACKTTGSRAPARQINAKMGAEGSPSQRISELPGFSGATKFFAATCQVSENRGAAGFDAVVGVPTFVIGIFEGERRSRLLRDMDAKLWIADRWWWFPTASTDLDLAMFEWRGNWVYFLEPDGSAVDGVVFVGEIATN